jgi:hypothetical protein
MSSRCFLPHHQHSIALMMKATSVSVATRRLHVSTSPKAAILCTLYIAILNNLVSRYFVKCYLSRKSPWNKSYKFLNKLKPLWYIMYQTIITEIALKISEENSISAAWRAVLALDQYGQCGTSASILIMQTPHALRAEMHKILLYTESSQVPVKGTRWICPSSLTNILQKCGGVEI